MRIKLDENLPEGLATLLRSAKHEVATALEENLGGGKDTALAAAAKQEGRVLMTNDVDFADIRSTRRGVTPELSFSDSRITGGGSWRGQRVG